MRNLLHFADQLGMLEYAASVPATAAAKQLSEILRSAAAKVDAVTKDVMPHARGKQYDAVRAEAQAEISKFRPAMEQWGRQSQPTMPKSTLSKDDLREIRQYKLPSLLMKNGFVDPVLLGSAMDDTGLLHALLDSPTNVLSAGDKDRIMQHLGQATQTAEQKQQALDSALLASLIATAERGLME